MLEEDWDLLVSFFPANWEWLATRTKALKGLHGDRSPAKALRVLLMHVGCGLSLRETAVRARESSVADLSDVAILKRLRKSKNWLRQLCLKLFRERGVPLGRTKGRQVRIFDATTVKEPGKTGSLWRIHYSVQLPSLTCDFFEVTRTAGAGTGESFRRFPVSAGDYILADRGYCHGPGIEYVHSNGAFVCVRVNSRSLRMQDADGNSFTLVDHLITVTRPGQVACWPVEITGQSTTAIQGRLCVVRKTQTAIDATVKRLKGLASKKGRNSSPTPWWGASTSSCSPRFRRRPSPRRTCCSGTECGGRSNWSSSASSRSLSLGICPNTRGRVRKRGCTASCSLPC